MRQKAKIYIRQIMSSAKSNLIMTQLYRCAVNFCIYVCKMYVLLLLQGMQITFTIRSKVEAL